ncbi:hypothetical protein ACEWY4_024981 [Coilia grayii]|uniref:Ig-like domain-containing protein n=1 Tax=Coilia grayii TaxID=363190 RepID=A0ABD1IW93_9TELE
MRSATILIWFTSALVTVCLGSIVPTEIYGIKKQSIYLDFAANFSSLTEPKFWLRRENGARLVKNNKVDPKKSVKVQYFSGNFSVRLNHLTESDSGIYEAYDAQEWQEDLLASYKLVVLEAVPKPNIRTSLKHSHGNTPGQNCSFLVNCSASSSWASFNCDRQECKQLGSSLAHRVTIVLNNDNGSIECFVSNPASTHRASRQLPKTCIEDSQEKTEPSSHLQRDITLITSVACAAVLLLLCGTLLVMRRRAVKSKETSQKQRDIPTVIVTGSDADRSSGQEATSIYSVINKSARCSGVDDPAQISQTNKNKTSRSTNAEGEHRSPRQQKNRGKQCPLQEDSNMTIYTTATKPLEKHRPLEDKDRTIYATATKPLEEKRPLKDADRKIYDTPTATTRQSSPEAMNTTQTGAAQPDTVYYTLGHVRSDL